MRYALIYIIASQLVSLQDVFHLAVQFSKYMLHYSSGWWIEVDSNHRPPAYQAGALTD